MSKNKKNKSGVAAASGIAAAQDIGPLNSTIPVVMASSHGTATIGAKSDAATGKIRLK